MSFKKIREQLYKTREIRDYFLDKEYGKISGLKFVCRKAKEGLCSFMSRENIGMSKKWILLSGVLSGILISVLSFFEISNVVAYGIISVPLVFLSSLITIINAEEIAEKYMPPIYLSLLSGFYFLNQNIVSGILMIVLLMLILFPLTFGVANCAWSLVKNTVSVIFKPKWKRDMWEPLTIEDHKFLSQYMTEYELVLFLKEVKIYNDLPIAEMNKLRVKNRETVEDIRKETIQKELECNKEEKVKAYASTFYDKSK